MHCSAALWSRAAGAAVALVLLHGLAFAAGETATNVAVRTVPPVVYTAVQGAQTDGSGNAFRDQRARDNLSWMFHLVFESSERTELRLENATVTFTRDGAPLWHESYSRRYLQEMEWVKGEYRLSTRYFLDHVMFGKETAASPDLPPGGTVSWVRIPFAQPWFGLPDLATFTFELVDPSGTSKTLVHEVELHTREQKNVLRLPFDGTWTVVKGSQLDPVSHRWTGINGLTTFGWDFMKLGPGGAVYKGDGRSPRDRYSYGAPALAAAAGRVVHVRDDIPDYKGAPPRSALEKDGDIFAGNLVVIDHGGGEYSLTCHLLPGSVQVRPGDEVEAGQELGRVGEQGILHFNLMNGGSWLEADGLPAVFSDFERVMPLGNALAIELGNPVTGWVVRAAAVQGGGGKAGARVAELESLDYFPPRSGREWERRSPSSQGIDPERLDEALDYARRYRTKATKDLYSVMSARVQDEGHGGIIGPMQPRSDFSGLLLRNGFIVAEFGDTGRVDMTFSATKSFLAIVAGLAVDRGLIEDVEDPVGTYVRDGNFSGPHNAKVTWEHLLHMTSEWDGELWGKPYTVEVPEGHQLQEPGSVWIHNDVRVNLLSLSLMRVWNDPLPQVLGDLLMEPIGASNQWRWHGYRNSVVDLDGRMVESVSGGGHWGGGLFISARDLARVGLLMLHGGEWDGRQVLSRRWIDATLTPSTELPTYGYLTWVNTGGQLWPSAPPGSFAFRGFGSNVVWVDPEHDLVLVLRWFDWDRLDGILKRLLAAVEDPS